MLAPNFSSPESHLYSSGGFIFCAPPHMNSVHAPIAPIAHIAHRMTPVSADCWPANRQSTQSLGSTAEADTDEQEIGRKLKTEPMWLQYLEDGDPK